MANWYGFAVCVLLPRAVAHRGRQLSSLGVGLRCGHACRGSNRHGDDRCGKRHRHRNRAPGREQLPCSGHLAAEIGSARTTTLRADTYGQGNSLCDTDRSTCPSPLKFKCPDCERGDGPHHPRLRERDSAHSHALTRLVRLRFSHELDVDATHEPAIEVRTKSLTSETLTAV